MEAIALDRHAPQGVGALSSLQVGPIPARAGARRPRACQPAGGPAWKPLFTKSKRDRNRCFCAKAIRGAPSPLSQQLLNLEVRPAAASQQPDGAGPVTQAAAAAKLTKGQKEAVLRKLVADGWLRHGRANGHYSLGVGSGRGGQGFEAAGVASGQGREGRLELGGAR